MLQGRDAERTRLRAVVDGACGGHAGALLVHGEPGVGKTALLDDLVAAAAAEGVRVLSTQGVESESPLAFGALHRLLRPVMRFLDRVPKPQSRALRVAFGIEDGDMVEPFLVGAATLSLLGESAEQCPVLCVVDDAHWLDDASAGALLFAARRLDADRVAVVTVGAVAERRVVLEGSCAAREPSGRASSGPLLHQRAGCCPREDRRRHSTRAMFRPGDVPAVHPRGTVPRRLAPTRVVRAEAGAHLGRSRRRHYVAPKGSGGPERRSAV